jgi:hypothetical protein
MVPRKGCRAPSDTILVANPNAMKQTGSQAADKQPSRGEASGHLVQCRLDLVDLVQDRPDVARIPLRLYLGKLE